ncbi:uncharacterized protein LOC125369928 [Ricinus communis]|uniref:uncharacterized protein LOC125369928 n=1 Tax=Ricinus communis TaxID=3988 RepID=UPI00201A317F|nr:uncharacterized protein LOC125369928 [Ricinus communis]
MSIQLVDRTVKYPKGIIEDVLVKVNKFIFPLDFVVMDMNGESDVPLILGRPFLATSKALIDVSSGKLELRVDDESITFDLTKSLRYPYEHDGTVCSIDFINDIVESQLQEIMINDPLHVVMQEYEDNLSNEQVLKSGVKKLKPSLEEPPVLELKELPAHLMYAYLDEVKQLPVIISAHLTPEEREMVLCILRRYAKILMEDEFKPVVQPQRQLNPQMKEVVKKEIIKLLDAGLIYPISIRSWIPIALEDQEKTTFTCPYGTFAYRRMLPALCNVPATFQRCMMAIFHDMIDESMEVFMDDFSIFGLEVDRAKVKVISKLPPPTSVRAVRSFLGHARAFELLKEKLTTAPIMVSPDWELPFELMCDASDFTVGAVLGQRKEKKFQPIYYASKTLTDAQEHYTTTEKELLAVVFAFDKFCSYLILSNIIVYTDHSALRYLFSKHDSKPRLIRWVLLLQEFDLEIKDKQGVRKSAQDHLSRLENPHLEKLNEKEIDDFFPDEHLCSMQVANTIPWFSDYANYLRKDQIIRRCVYGEEIIQILKHCHEGPVGGHQAANHTARKVMDAGRQRQWQINELEEWRQQAYENSTIYKVKTKQWHDKRLKNLKEFNVGDSVLLFNSRLRLFPRKLKSHWSGPFTVTQVFHYGAVEVHHPKKGNFKVNGQRLKHYLGGSWMWRSVVSPFPIQRKE